MIPRYDPAADYEIEVTEEIYRRGSDGDWPVRLYRPVGDGPFPTLLDVHGGAWSTGSYLNNEGVDTALARSGMLVAAIEFRQAPDHTYPSQVADVNYGTRWLKANAPRLGGDAATLGAFGSSSGGHSLMLSTLKPNDPRYASETLDSGDGIDATVAYAICGWPVLCSHARYVYARDAGVARLMKSSENYFGDEATMQEGSPQMVLDRDEQTALPPLLVLQGTDDDNVPLEISERFVARYLALGGSAMRELFPGMPHAFARDPGPETDRAIQLMKAFVARQFEEMAA